MRFVATLSAALLACALVSATAAAAPGDVVLAQQGFAAKGSILRITPAGAASTVATSLGEDDSPADVAFTSRGDLLLIDGDAPGPPGYAGTLYRVNPLSGVLSPVAGGADPFGSGRGVDLMPNGDAVIVEEDYPPSAGDAGRGAVFLVDLVTGQTTVLPVSPLFEEPVGVATSPAGEIFVADEHADVPAGDGAILRVDAKTGAATPVYAPELGVNNMEIRGVARRPDGKLLVLISSINFNEQHGVVLVDPGTGVADAIALATSPTFDSLQGIALAPDGSIYVSDSGGAGARVHRIDPASGAVSTAATTAALQESPAGLVVEPPRCAGRTATIVGSEGRDKLTGSPFADVIAGVGGNDMIKGGKGKDRICGGRGRDRISGGKGADRCTGGKGRDSGSCERGKL